MSNGLPAAPLKIAPARINGLARQRIEHPVRQMLTYTYQMITRSFGARYILSPGLTLNAS